VPLQALQSGWQVPQTPFLVDRKSEFIDGQRHHSPDDMREEVTQMPANRTRKRTGAQKSARDVLADIAPVGDIATMTTGGSGGSTEQKRYPYG
jgi:hypothetical protein